MSALHSNVAVFIHVFISIKQGPLLSAGALDAEHKWRSKYRLVVRN
jgi:hypothetical protein